MLQKDIGSAIIDMPEACGTSCNAGIVSVNGSNNYVVPIKDLSRSNSRSSSFLLQHFSAYLIF